MVRSSSATRPADWERYREVLSRLVSAAGVARGLAFQPHPTDVILSPYAKSGTTWLQQIVHGLRTRGDMDFDDISRVIPWIETAYDLGLDLDAPQVALPRAFKSHLGWRQVPKGGRYIVSLRDPKDVLVSLFRFKEGWFFEPGSIPIARFARREFFHRGEGRDYWDHLVSWWEHRNDDNVLLLCYEEMKLDLAGTVRAVAAHIEVALDRELLDLVERQASLDFMLAHKDRFDDFLMRERSEQECGLPAGSDSAKVRKGEVGAHAYELPSEVAEEMDGIWASEIESRLGFADYQELREAFVPSA